MARLQNNPWCFTTLGALNESVTCCKQRLCFWWSTERFGLRAYIVTVCDKGVRFPSTQRTHTHTHRYLHSTCLSCASLLLCTVSVWGWLVHGTSLKIDIRSLCKGKVDKGVRGNESAWGSKRVWQRQRKTKAGKKKERQRGRPKTYLCTKLVLKENKHTHLLEFDMKMEKEVNISGVGNITVFQESKWGHVTATKV